MKLKDFFPENLKQSLRDSQIGVGSVIKMFDENATPPKYKRFVITAICKDGVTLASVYVNTNINTNVYRNKRLRDWHLSVKAEGNDYLDHDSFIDCSKIYKRSVENIASFLDNNEDDECGHIGSVSEADLEKIRTKIISAEKISERDKKKFGFIKD